MRVATFNIESLDLPPRAKVGLEARAAVLRPLLQRVDADILCLQEVNGQHVVGRPERVLAALDLLLAGTRYATYERAHTTGADGVGAVDVHNLVTLSRLPIREVRQVHHELVEPPRWRARSTEPPAAEPLSAGFERPLLATRIEIRPELALWVVNLHLRSPLASPIGGHKLAPFVWDSTGAWAEGLMLSTMKRAGQALELRLLLDQMLDDDPAALIAVAGDFNAEDHEVPLKMVVAAEEDTGNGALAVRSLVVLDRALAADRRWSVLHHGRPQMLDHILASRRLYGHFKGIEVMNEALGDEAVGFAKVDRSLGSYHAPLVATFGL